MMPAASLTSLRKYANRNETILNTTSASVDNDNVERKKRQSLYNNENVLPSTSKNNSMAFMDMEQVKNHINMCRKLFYENKINIHNAWNIKIIDCMNLYVSNNKIDTETMLVAAITLDICIKVYGFKLEYLEKEIQRLIQAIQPTKINRKGDTIDEDNIEDTDVPQKFQVRNRKKRLRCTIVKDKAALTCQEIPKVSSVHFIGHRDVYASISENMFTNKIPMDHAAYKFHLLNNAENGFPSYEANDPTLGEQLFLTTVPDVISLNICPIFRTFNVDEDDDRSNDASMSNDIIPSNPSHANDEIVYDDDGFPVPELDESVHDVFEEHTNDVDNIEHIAVAGQGARKRTRMITSFCPTDEVISKTCEHSALTDSLVNTVWVGPSHWKNKLIRPLVTTFSGRSNKGEPPVKRKRKSTEIENLDFIGSVTSINLNEKTTKSISLNIDRYTLPMSLLCPPDFDTLNEINLIPDKEYHMSITESEHENEVQEDDILGESLPDNIVEENNNINSSPEKDKCVENPEIENQAYVPYAIRSKRISMRKLKIAMLECLLLEDGNNDTNKEKLGELKPNTSTTLSAIYKKLPEKLPSKIRSEVSVPLTFFTLLHLASVHNLKLTGCPNLNDIKIG